MVKWGRLFNWDGHDSRHVLDEARSLLPYARNHGIPSAVPAREVTRIALRLKHQIETVIPCEMEESRVTAAHSGILTPAVIATAKSAGKYGGEGDSSHDYSACVVYCLLICRKWFRRQALLELWDSELHEVRATACEVVAKRLIEAEEDFGYLFQEILLKRYSILVNGKETAATNVIEKAIDLHALRVIGSSGYQKCNSYLWRGWLVQDDDDPSRFIEYNDKASTDYWAHLDPDRMRVPLYQNALQIVFSFIYLALYTGAINTINEEGDLDIVEGLLYVFTVGFVFDEVSKVWKVGRYYLGFWNIFHTVLYVLLTVSFILRMVALSYERDSSPRIHYNTLSYNFLAFSAPLFWGRMLLYLDTFRFFGAMLVVMKVMMKESLIFFALVIVVLIGFLQAFVGMDHVHNDTKSSVVFVFRALIDGLMDDPDFQSFDHFAPPLGLILYYCYNFIISVTANTSYQSCSTCLLRCSTLRTRTLRRMLSMTPDENVFIAPFNLIEIFGLILPFEWWMSKERYQRLNRWVMSVIYCPMLLVTAAFETHTAFRVRWNRKRGEVDEDTTEEWEELSDEVDFEGEGWSKAVEQTKPNVEVDGTLLAVRELKKEIEDLKEQVGRLSRGTTPAPE
ncbi:hypothetical protein ANO11243_024960 [Dothideomycetidae sp. 11243]|nr:hypothetical protein ANO11243_024960 [fungal sp. No.11243]